MYVCVRVRVCVVFGLRDVRAQWLTSFLPSAQATFTSGTAATNGSTSGQFTATFSSADSFVTNTQNLSNIGLFATSAAGTLFAGNTFASSSCATNQNVNVTYNINFA